MHPATPERPTLLLAERDDSARAALARALELAGQRVLEAVDLAACRDLLECERPTSIVLDLGLTTTAAGERPDPVSLCREVLELPGAQAAKLIVCVADWETTPVQQLLQLGVAEFIQRPVLPELLLHRLRGVTAAHHQTATHYEFDSETLLTRQGLVQCINSSMPAARGEGSHIGILVISFEAGGQEAGGLQSGLPAGEGQEGEGQTEMCAPAESSRPAELAVRHLFAALEKAGYEGVHVALLDDVSLALAVPGIERIQDTAKLGNLLHGFLDEACPGSPIAIGIAAFPEDEGDGDALLDCARRAAHRAHQAGRSIQFHTEPLGKWALERLTLERSLRQAILNQELRVFYQPRLDIQTRRMVGMEALVRWQHPELGLVSPDQFIPLAEETGLIVPIGDWVLRQACHQNQAWRDQGLPPIRVSVNLSPIQFRKPDLYDTVVAALNDTGLSTDGLELEVTESMLMNDPKKTIATLKQFKSAGIHISIDDFGTGYSSLSYLKRFPIDALKIDRSFIDQVTTNADDAAITTAIILMGHSLRLSIVAEGVETESQLAFLKLLRCNEAQGFLFSRPVPAEQATALLAREEVAAA